MGRKRKISNLTPALSPLREAFGEWLIRRRIMDENTKIQPVPEAQDMTLRDYFAGQALSNIAEYWNGKSLDPKATAKAAYAIADEMMKERHPND